MATISDKYLTTAEAARLLGFTPDYVRQLIQDGKIKVEKIAGNYVMLPTALKGLERQRARKSENGSNKRRNKVDRSGT